MSEVIVGFTWKWNAESNTWELVPVIEHWGEPEGQKNG
jgi:hypothetical protein